MRRRLVTMSAVLAAVAIGCTAPSAGAPPPSVDQQFVPGTLPAQMNLVGSCGSVKLAQTFAPARSGTIKKVSVVITGDESPSVTISIQAAPNGFPTGPVLATGVAPAVSPDQYTLVDIALSSPAPVTRGQLYAIVPSCSGLDASITWHGGYGQVGSVRIDGYPGGGVLGGSGVPASEGWSNASFLGYDFFFTTWM